MLFQHIRADASYYYTGIGFRRRFDNALSVFRFFFRRSTRDTRFLARNRQCYILRLNAARFRSILRFSDFAFGTFARLIGHVCRLGRKEMGYSARANQMNIIDKLAFIGVIIQIRMLVFAFLIARRFRASVNRRFINIRICKDAYTTLMSICQRLVRTFSIIRSFVAYNGSNVHCAFEGNLRLFIYRDYNFFGRCRATGGFEGVASFIITSVRIFGHSRDIGAVMNVD